MDANDDPTGIAGQIFDNRDFGYYKMNIDRPDRCCTQFSADRLAPLRFAKALRDAESVPLSDSIHCYYTAEVKPHVDEAWINLDSVKIGYEISFNKYFYRHKPLRSLADVTADILGLEQ